MAFNLVVLSGRLTADTELKTTPNGISVCTFNIAVDRGYGDNKATDFITIVAWRGTAEFVAKHFRKGDLIGIEGSIQTRKYTDKNGNNRTAFEVVANNIQFVGGKKTDNEQPEVDPPQQFAQNNADFDEVSGDDDLPF